MAIAHRCEVRVYDRTGTGSYTALPASNVSFSVGLGGSGFCSFEVDARYSALVSSPTMLDDCVVKLAIPTDGTDTATEWLAYANRARNGILWDGAGRKVRRVQSAPTLWTAWSQDAVLHPETNAIAQMSASQDGQRYFGWMSSIYDYGADATYTWAAPNEVYTYAASTGDRAGNPDGWPTELNSAYWITRPSPSNGLRHLFVNDLTVASDTYLTIYASSDESLKLWFGGELVLQTSSRETGYLNVDTWTAYVTAGTYRVAAEKTSATQGDGSGDGVDPILVGIASNDSAGAISAVLMVSDNSWDGFTLDPVTGVTPSLTPGEIMLELHSQAAARGVDTWAAITPTFSATADTDSTAWGFREERAWRVGFDRYLDMIEGLGDLGIDVEITPALDFNAYYERGTDLSATVEVEALVDVDSITESGVGVEGTVLYVETQDGWVPEELTANTGTYGRRETALSLGNAPSVAQGKRLGQKVLDERLARPTSEWSIDCYAKAAAVPLEDFGLGDTIAVTIDGVTTDRVVLEIGGQAESTAAIIRWTIKTGEVIA